MEMRSAVGTAARAGEGSSGRENLGPRGKHRRFLLVVFVVLAALLSFYGLAISGAWLVARRVGQRVPRDAEMVAISDERVLLVWHSSPLEDRRMFFALYDGSSDRELWRFSVAGEPDGRGGCKTAGRYVACAGRQNMGQDYSVHLFDDDGHVATLDTTPGGEFALDESGTLAVLSVDARDSDRGRVVVRPVDGRSWERDVALRLGFGPLVLTPRHVVVGSTAWTRSGERAQSRAWARSIGVSPEREERLVFSDGTLWADSLDEDVEREGPSLDGQPCLLGRRDNAWIVAENAREDDGSATLLALDIDSLEPIWRAELAQAGWLDCEASWYATWGETRTDAELPPEIVVLTSSENLVIPSLVSRSALLLGISLADGHVIWSSPVPVGKDPAFVARRGDATYVFTVSPFDGGWVLRFEAATLTGAVWVKGPIGPLNFLEDGFWAPANRPPRFVRAPELDADGADDVVDIRDEVAGFGPIPNR